MSPIDPCVINAAIQLEGRKRIPARFRLDQISRFPIGLTKIGPGGLSEDQLFADQWNFIFSVQSNISGRLDCPQVTFFGEEMFLKVFADMTERN